MSASLPQPRRCGGRRAVACLLMAACLVSLPAAAAARPLTCDDWRSGAVVYGVVPTLFGDPPLQKVTERIPTIAAQGADVLWLAPVMKTDDPSAISYAIVDGTGVREDFGTEDDLRALVKTAHAHGLRVILDIVPNHVSTGHPWYQDAQSRGPLSPSFGYFQRDASGEAVHYFDWKNLKNLDFSHPAVRRHTTAQFLHWVRAFDVDGFRVDAAWGIQTRAPDYWAELTSALRAEKPDLFLLAEAGARDPAYLEGGFDAAYDWTHELGKWSWEFLFDSPRTIAPKLKQALAQNPPQTVHQVARFLNNNDTGERFISRYGLQTTRVAAVLVHTVPGIPIVYTGDEIGAEFLPYEDPPPLVWRDPHRLSPLYRRLADLKQTLPALRCGALQMVPVSGAGAPATLAYARDAGERGRALVVLNFGEASRVRLEVPAALRTTRWMDALTSTEVRATVDARGHLVLPLKKGAALVLTPPGEAAR